MRPTVHRAEGSGQPSSAQARLPTSTQCRKVTDENTTHKNSPATANCHELSIRCWQGKRKMATMCPRHGRDMSRQKRGSQARARLWYLLQGCGPGRLRTGTSRRRRRRPRHVQSPLGHAPAGAGCVTSLLRRGRRNLKRA